MKLKEILEKAKKTLEETKAAVEKGEKSAEELQEAIAAVKEAQENLEAAKAAEALIDSLGKPNEKKEEGKERKGQD